MVPESLCKVDSGKECPTLRIGKQEARPPSPPLWAGSARLASWPEFLWPSGGQLGTGPKVSGPSMPTVGDGAARRKVGGQGAGGSMNGDVWPGAGGTAVPLTLCSRHSLSVILRSATSGEPGPPPPWFLCTAPLSMGGCRMFIPGVWLNLRIFQIGGRFCFLFLFFLTYN